MTYFITISLICLISFLIILVSLNNQKESQKAQLLDTSATETWIKVVKVLFFISLGVFLYGIYITYKSEIDKKRGKEKSLFTDILSTGKEYFEDNDVFVPPTFSDEWIKYIIRNI